MHLPPLPASSSNGASSNGNRFLKLKNGESVHCTFAGTPRLYFTVWNEKTGKSQEVPEGEGSPRFEVNVIVKIDGSYVAKVFGSGANTYRTLVALAKDYALDQYLFRLSREGMQKETRYTLIPLPNGKLSAEQLQDLHAVPLHPLHSWEEQKSFALKPLENDDVPF